MVCRTVLLAAVCAIIPRPVKKIRNIDMKNDLLIEMAINPVESNAVAAGISRPSLRTVFREAR